MSQLALPLQLQDHAVFASFLSTGNEALVEFLEKAAAGSPGVGCWLWGGAATGKTHLLQAVCERAGDEALFLPMAVAMDAGPAILDGLENRRIVCLDDIHLAAGDSDWEVGLFALCNSLTDAGSQLVCSATTASRQVDFGLDDLASRLSRLPVFQVHALDEPARMTALKLRAEHRGLDLPDETARYLLTRARRDMSHLYALLDHLDAEALKAQRRLTIPFVREVLDLG